MRATPNPMARETELPPLLLTCQQERWKLQLSVTIIVLSKRTGLASTYQTLEYKYLPDIYPSNKTADLLHITDREPAADSEIDTISRLYCKKQGNPQDKHGLARQRRLRGIEHRRNCMDYEAEYEGYGRISYLKIFYIFHGFQAVRLRNQAIRVLFTSH